MNVSGKFVGRLRLEYVDGRTWKLINPDDVDLFAFILDDGRSVVPPDGMITDFASIPRVVWAILPPCGDGPRGKWGPGSVIHDWIYKTGKINGKSITQHEADHVLRACNESLCVAHDKITIIHDALVVGGFVAWNEYRRVEGLAA
jgi:hypothetical protein